MSKGNSTKIVSASKPLIEALTQKWIGGYIKKGYISPSLGRFIEGFVITIIYAIATGVFIPLMNGDNDLSLTIVWTLLVTSLTGKDVISYITKFYRDNKKKEGQN